jgi:putative PIN family toxin of toxin-antitoxin system
MKAYSSTVLCASIETMDELDKVILRPKFDPYLDKETRAGFVASLRQNVQIFAIGAGETAVAGLDCRDPKDNKFLALALAAEADLIISSDHDLLVLNPWNGIAILTPAEFLA